MWAVLSIEVEQQSRCIIQQCLLEGLGGYLRLQINRVLADKSLGGHYRAVAFVTQQSQY